MKARALILVALGLALLPALPAQAHDTHSGSYRKWPWRAGWSRTLTTLPDQCPHCAGSQSSSAWKAIDVAMAFETVYSVAPGVVDRFEPSGGHAGKYLRIRDDDGSYITYEHLKKSLVRDGDRVVAGQPIAVSGNSGRSSGPHLHFQRHDAPSFSSRALPLTPLSGHGGPGDPLQRTAYLSDNGGIGHAVGGEASTRMVAAYDAAGGYTNWGVTSNLRAAWSPCHTVGAQGSWFRYTCSPTQASRGSVQTFRGPGNKKRALMTLNGASAAYQVHQAILAAYTEVHGGMEWVARLGYPTGNRRPYGSVLRQDFQFGYVDFDPAACTERMVVGTTLMATYHYCD